MKTPSKPMFWRDARMPYVELRKVEDGRKVCYAPHSHTQWSMGAITEGRCSFLYIHNRYEVSAGDLVMVNPEWLHACNPLEDQPWAYLMLYIDSDWLTQLRYSIGHLSSLCWQDITTAIVSNPRLFAGYVDTAECLLSTRCSIEQKNAHLKHYLMTVFETLPCLENQLAPEVPVHWHDLANYLKVNITTDLSINSLCERMGFSSGHLIRSFKQHTGFTPHSFRINGRVQCGQQELKHGKTIAQAALNAGFADQSHFQRTFKKLLAATPNEYRQSLLNQQIDAACNK